MVQLSNPAMLQHEKEAAELGSREKPGSAVKIEVDDNTEEEYAPLNKRSRSSNPFQQDQQRRLDSDAPSVSSQLVQCNLLSEPSPLGLRLRKSPSLLELIQMKLAQSSAEPCNSGSASETGKKKDPKAAGTVDKLKASNFPASLLKIGNWECISRYEGDLVAKCYFAKHKLVWEVLDGGLKSKIEIQWSDITALKASCLENGPGTLDIVLGRQPLFYRETNPQPRKHTLWQATSDFTGGQASIHRRHFLQCPPGLLSKHFEKLIQCDPRLNSLSQQQEIILDSPFFEPRCSVFDSQEDDKGCFNHTKTDLGPSFSGFQETSPSCSFLSTSSKSDLKDAVGRTPESSSMETPSPVSGLDGQITEENTSFETEKLKDPSSWDQLKVPGLHPSMSMTDLVNHIGNCISEKASGHQANSVMNKEMLDEITQYLLGDSQLAAASDEGSLMSRVNSLCCLLQNPTPTENRRAKDGIGSSGSDTINERELAESKRPVLEFPTFEVGGNDSKQPPSMSRKDSFGDLLLHLPRIASLPQFLFNISEDGEGDSR